MHSIKIAVAYALRVSMRSALNLCVLDDMHYERISEKKVQIE